MTKIVTFSSIAELALPNHALRRRSDDVRFDRDDVRVMSNVLREAIRSEEIAVGFAGPQLGIPKRIAIINHKKKSHEHERILINPEIEEFGGALEAKFESCMSLPGLRAIVPRASYVIVRYLTEFAEEKTLRAEGFLARIVFHEVDHLNGMMFTDHLASLAALEPMQSKRS